MPKTADDLQPEPKRTKKQPRVPKKLARVAFGSLVLLLALEAGLRLGGFSHAPRPSFEINFFSTHRIVQPSPDTLWTARPDSDHTVEASLEVIKNNPVQTARVHRMIATQRYEDLSTHINKLGMHNREDFSAKKPANTFRVLCIGGSTPWSYSDTQNWTSFLQEQWQAFFGATQKVQVMNASVPGVSSAQALLRYQHELKEVEADVVILMSEKKQSIVNRLRIIQLAHSIRAQSSSNHKSQELRGPRVPLPEYENNIAELEKAVAKRNGKLLICTEPSTLSVLDPSGGEAKSWARDGHTPASQKAYNDAAQKVAKRLGLPVAKVAEACAPLPQAVIRQYFFEPEGDPIHLAIPGHRFRAKQIFLTLKQSPGYLRTAEVEPKPVTE